MQPNPSGQNVMNALNWIQRAMFRTKEKGKRVVFVITQTKFADNVNTIKSVTKGMQRGGNRVFSIGIGDAIDKVQIQGIANNKKDFYMTEPILHVPLALMSLQSNLLRCKLLFLLPLIPL